MDTQHEKQRMMDLNIDPKTMTKGNWRILKMKFQALKLREQEDVIKLFDVYLKALEFRQSDFIVKVRDGRVVNGPKAIDVSWPQDKSV